MEMRQKRFLKNIHSAINTTQAMNKKGKAYPLRASQPKVLGLTVEKKAVIHSSRTVKKLSKRNGKRRYFTC